MTAFVTVGKNIEREDIMLCFFIISEIVPIVLLRLQVIVVLLIVHSIIEYAFAAIICISAMAFSLSSIAEGVVCMAKQHLK